MARRQALRAVAPDEKPARPLSITEAASAGNTRALLVAMRARVAEAVQDPNCPARDLAALTRRLHELVREIEAMDARESEDASAAEVEDGTFDASAV